MQSKHAAFRRTYRSPSDANSRREPEEKEANKQGTTDGLAGLDISNFSKVVTIDDHLQETAASDGPDDFEEVVFLSCSLRIKASGYEQEDEETEAVGGAVEAAG